VGHAICSRWDRRSVCVVCRHCYLSLTDHEDRWSVPPRTPPYPPTSFQFRLDTNARAEKLNPPLPLTCGNQVYTVGQSTRNGIPGKGERVSFMHLSRLVMFLGVLLTAPAFCQTLGEITGEVTDST